MNFKNLLFIFSLTFLSEASYALTANRVWYEFHPTFFRIYIQYTLPELKEYREASIDFKSKKEAEKFYSALLRGAEFSLNNNQVVFEQNPKAPDPW